MAKSTGLPRKREELEDEEEPRKRGQAPGRTIEARENQIISLAYDLVEERIKKKTATSQEVTQFIKAGSVQAQLEKAKLLKENELLEAKQKLLNLKRELKNFAAAMKA
jgi:hypothetical protein